MKRSSSLPMLALATALCATQAHAQTDIEFNDTSKTPSFLFDFPGNTPSVASPLGDVGYYDLRDGAMVLYSGWYVQPSNSQASVIPNLIISSTAAIPNNWFIEIRLKANLDKFPNDVNTGLIIGTDLNNYATVGIKHATYNGGNSDYFNVELKQNGAGSYDTVQDFSAFYPGTNYGYVTVRIQANPTTGKIEFSTTYPDGSVHRLPAVGAGDTTHNGGGNGTYTYNDVYNFLNSIAGKRIGFYVESGYTRSNGVPVYFQYLKTNLPLASTPSTQPLFTEDFDGQDSKLSFQYPNNTGAGSSDPNTENPGTYSIDHGAFSTNFIGSIYQQYNYAKNLLNLPVSTTATIPSDWYFKARVKTAFTTDGTNYNYSNAGLFISADPDNWVTYSRKHHGNEHNDYYELFGEFSQVYTYGVLGDYYPLVSDQSGYASLTVQKVSATGNIVFTFVAEDGSSRQSNYLASGDTSSSGGNTPVNHSVVYNLINNIAGKRIGIYGESDGTPVYFDQIQTNLPLLRTVNPVIAGTITFDSLKTAVAPWQTVNFEFRPVGGGTTIKKTVSVPPTGEFKFYGIPAGHYTVAAKAVRFLRGTADLDTTPGADVTNGALTLLAGDIFTDDGSGTFMVPDNNIVDVNDLFSLLAVFNTAKGDGTGLYEANPTADIDEDGKIGVDDLFALLNNFNLTGQN